jgi:predicted nucleic acid-binding protein
MAEVALDAGALIALQRGERGIWNLLRESVRQGVVLSISAAALAQVWRGEARSARLAQAVPRCEIIPLDDVLAKKTGELLASSKTRDVVDACVVASAERRQATIVTSDVLDLQLLANHALGVSVLDLKDVRKTTK